MQIKWSQLGNAGLLRWEETWEWSRTAQFWCTVSNNQWRPWVDYLNPRCSSGSWSFFCEPQKEGSAARKWENKPGWRYISDTLDFWTALNYFIKPSLLFTWHLLIIFMKYLIPRKFVFIRISPISKYELHLFSQNDGGYKNNRKKILLSSVKTSTWTWEAHFKSLLLPPPEQSACRII